MTKEEFNNLNIQEQVKYINESLKNNSLSSIGKIIGVSEATIRTRFKKGGYMRIDNQFVNVNEANTRAIEPIKKKVDANILMNKIKALEGRLNTLENTINANNTTTINPGNTIQVHEFKGDTVSRAYRLDKEVQEQFKIFCKRNSEYKVQDLLSTALLEYMKNNK